MAGEDAGLGVLKVVAGLFGLVSWIVLLGLQRVWGATFGWVFRTLGTILDDITIPIPFRADLHPFGSVADWLRSLDRNVSHALAAAALGAEHLAVWLFTRLRFVAHLLGRELRALANELVAQLLRLVTVYLPRWLGRLMRQVTRGWARIWHYVRSQLPAIWRLLKRYGRSIARAAGRELRHWLKLLKRFLWLERKLLGFIRSAAHRLTALERKLVPGRWRKWLAALFPIFGISWLLGSSWKRLGRGLLRWSHDMITAFLRYFGRLDDAVTLENLTEEAQDLVGVMTRALDFWISEFDAERLAPGPIDRDPNA